MHSDFILKVRRLSLNLEKITIHDLHQLNQFEYDLLKEIEKTITSTPLIGQKQLKHNFNEIIQEYRNIRIIECLNLLEKYPQKNGLVIKNIKEFDLRCRHLLSSLLMLLLDYFPEFASKNRGLYITYCPSLLERLAPQQSENSKHDLPKPQLHFSDPEILSKFFKLLKAYFLNREEDLLNALKGIEIETPLFFLNNQNKFVEVFRRLKYNGYIISSATDIKDWICLNFEFRYKRGALEEKRPFNPSSVWDILTKGAGEPPKKGRICYEGVEWLPYKSKRMLDDETQKEQLLK